MDNLEISALLGEMADALEYLEEPFRARAYRRAAEAVSSLDVPAGALIAEGAITGIPGIGKGISTTLAEWGQGDFSSLAKLTERLPEGLSELLKVPGLGLKRIRKLQGRGIETIEGLMSALEEGRLASFRGLTPRYEARIRKAVQEIIAGRGRVLLDQALETAEYINGLLAANAIEATPTGELRRTLETVGPIEFILDASNSAEQKVKKMFTGSIMKSGNVIVLRLRRPPEIRFILADSNAFHSSLLLTTGSRDHLDKLKTYSSRHGYEISGNAITKNGIPVILRSEDAFYELLGLSPVPPEIREGKIELDLASSGRIPVPVNCKDIAGTMHVHTTYSDGRESLSAMSNAARSLGYKWLGIADHSVSARYAGGMSEKAVKKQHAEIDALNIRGGISILKGVECDIQPDGSLDYSNEILESFDYVIAGVHTGMDMDEASMTERVIRAVRHPMTSILAHPTGRLLLSRNPYEIDLDAVLEECLKNNVAVEINANPQRLDLDWRKVNGFAAAGGMIALCPDAHDGRGLQDMRYGLMMARKGSLTAGSTINSLEFGDLRSYFKHCK